MVCHPKGAAEDRPHNRHVITSLSVKDRESPAEQGSSPSFLGVHSMPIPLQTNTKNHTYTPIYLFCSGVCRAYRSLPTYTCPSRQAKALTCSGGTVRRSLSRPTPSLHPPSRYHYHSDSTPHTATLPSVCVPPTFPYQVRWGSVLRVLSCLSDTPRPARMESGATIRYPHGLRLTACPRGRIGSDEPSPRKETLKTSCTASLSRLGRDREAVPNVLTADNGVSALARLTAT